LTLAGADSVHLRALDGRLAVLEGAGRRGQRARQGTAAGTVGFSQLQGQYASIMSILEDADLPPTTQAVAALEATTEAAKKTWSEWAAVKREINDHLK